MSRGLIAAMVLAGAVACSRSSTDAPKSPPANPTPKDPGLQPPPPTPVAVDAGPPKAKLSDPETNRTPPTCEPHKVGAAPDKSLGGCKSNADCKDAKNGFCFKTGGGHDVPHNECGYDVCATDADCGKGTACQCEFNGNYCVQAGCRTSADCGGKACSLDYGCRGGVNGWQCHRDGDECNSNVDCKDPGTSCHFSPEVGHWKCINPMCPVG